MGHAFDLITEQALRVSAGLKWSAFPDCIGAFVAEMDFPIASEIESSLATAIRNGRTGYPAPAQATELADACADWQQRRFGWHVASARIHGIGDVLGALEIALHQFVPGNRAVVLPTPAYMPFKPLLESMGQQVIEVPMQRIEDTWRMDLAGIDTAFGQGAGMIVLCNPHNPTGRVFDHAELAALSDVVKRHGARVFSDEIHAPLVLADKPHVPYAAISDTAASQAITAVSASKGWNLPGLKCAQLILTNDADQSHWTRIGMIAGHSLSGLGMFASIAAYRHGIHWLDAVTDYLRGNLALIRERLAAELPHVGFIPPEGTYLAWLDLRGTALPDASAPARFLRERARLALTDGRECGLSGAGHVRMNFAMPRPILDEALTRLVATIGPK